MDNKINSQLTEVDIHALVDGQVPAEQLNLLQNRMAQDPVAQHKYRQWLQQREALRQLQTEVLHDPLPSALVSAAQQTLAKQHLFNQWWRWGGVAAGLVMTFGIGWMSNSLWRTGWLNESSASKAPAHQTFVKQASLAYGVYTPEMRHPVEVAAAEEAHLVQWLSKRLGKTLKIPSLTALGYDLVGGRLLPGEASARAQFMFQNKQGTRVTLYLGAVDKPSKEFPMDTSSFQFMPNADVPSFYWVDQGFGYALSGQVPREALYKLAESVYQQL